MSKFKALVVDFGGVLTTPLYEAVGRFADEMDIELQDLLRTALALYAGGEDDLVAGFETGKISEEEFTAAFAGRLSNLCARPVEPEGLLERVFGSVRFEETMFEAVAAARAAGLKTGLLSNSWGMDLYPMSRLEQLFDVIVISGQVGLRKPDQAIFRLMIDELQVAPEECLFVDDHNGHLEGAKSAGMATLLHVSPDATIADLEALLGCSCRSAPPGA